MTERCPHCHAKNTRVRHEYTLQGWPHDDDYCGVCGKNWPRPDVDPRTRKVEPIESHR